MKQKSNAYPLMFDKKKKNRLAKFMGGLFVVCIAFAAGFIMRGNTDLLTGLGFDTAVNNSEANPGMTISGETYDSLAPRISEVQGILESDSVDTYDLDATTQQMLNVLSEATGDPFVSYLDQAHYETYLSSVNNSYRGIGVLFAEKDGKAYAVDVFSGSEAEAKGVRPDDVVVAIGGDRGTNGWTQAEVVRALDQVGPGESVVITWQRPGNSGDEPAEFAVDVTVSDYEEPNVRVELIDEQVGYIKLSQITSDSTVAVESAVEKLTEAGATSLILDLRNNPGGYLTQAVDIGALFVKSGTFVQVHSNQGPDTTIEVNTPTITDLPVVVIVNGKTAAAAEVLASGLQENNATVVGETTMGKGSVQSVKQLSFGGAFRYTSAYYRTKNGYEIDGNGITPDIQVSMGSSSSEDAQLTVAVDTAKTKAPQS